IKNVRLFALNELADFDHFLLAHAGVSGEAFDAPSPDRPADPTQKAIYFSPKRYALLAQLSPQAQAQFWRHELKHLEHPDWPEERVVKECPLTRVQLETALLLVSSVDANFVEADNLLSEASQRMASTQ